jgi:hypothetical protein
VTSHILSNLDIDLFVSISFLEMSEGLTSMLPNIYLSFENMGDIMTNLEVKDAKVRRL